MSAHATAALILPDLPEAFHDLADDYLETFLAPPDDGQARCPECGGGFEWGLAWGAGRCWQCSWPGRLYHVITDRRKDDALICSATCNGYRVCEATRGEHIPHDTTWLSEKGGSRIETTLRCPSPTVPPGLRAEHFTSDYRPPEIARFNLLLWVHPDYVETRPASAAGNDAPDG